MIIKVNKIKNSTNKRTSITLRVEKKKQNKKNKTINIIILNIKCKKINPFKVNTQRLKHYNKIRSEIKIL